MLVSSEIVLVSTRLLTMAHWTLVVLLVVSALMGLSQAYSLCSMDGRAHCVMPENCKVPITLGQRENTGCGESLVCCDVESVS